MILRGLDAIMNVKCVTAHSKEEVRLDPFLDGVTGHISTLPNINVDIRTIRRYDVAGLMWRCPHVLLQQ